MVSKTNAGHGGGQDFNLPGPLGPSESLPNFVFNNLRTDVGWERVCLAILTAKFPAKSFQHLDELRGRGFSSLEATARACDPSTFRSGHPYRVCRNSSYPFPMSPLIVPGILDLQPERRTSSGFRPIQLSGRWEVL